MHQIDTGVLNLERGDATVSRKEVDVKVGWHSQGFLSQATSVLHTSAAMFCCDECINKVQFYLD